MALKLKSDLLERFVPFLLIATVGLAFLVGVLWQKVSTLEKGGVAGTGTVEQAPPAAKVELDTVKAVFDKNVVKFGDKNRKVLFVEVSDPSCPYCHIANGANPEVAAQVGDKFKYVSAGGTYQPPLPEMRKLVDSGKAAYAFVYFPGHANGEMGSKALYCAFDQGKFWEAHDLLYSNKGYSLLNDTVKNDKTQSGTLANFLKGTVDAGELKSCIDSGKYDARLTEEQVLSQSSLMDPQQGGTPTFLVNATRFNGAYSWTDIKSTVDSILK